MPSNNSRYIEEMREKTAKLIIETGKSATNFAEETGIDINTVCRWVRDFRRKNKLPSYVVFKGIISQLGVCPRGGMPIVQIYTHTR